MQTIFFRAHQFTALWEGGYVNHKNDPGGATNYGVSLRWLTGVGLDVNGDGTIDAEDIKALTPDQARDLFRHYFWDYLNLDSLPALVAIAVYDGAVNQGCARSIKQLQAACNRFTGDYLTVDGIPGPRTHARARLFNSGTERQLLLADAVIREREEFHHYLAARPPKQNPNGSITDYKPFLSGWLNRTGALRGFVGQSATEGYA